MNTIFNQGNIRCDVWLILQITIVSAIAYLAGFHLTSLFHPLTATIGGLWAVISAVIVLQQDQEETRTSAWQRIMGTFIGAVLSGLYLFLFPFTVIGYALCMGAGTLVCFLVGLPSHVHLTGVTISVIMIVSFISQDIDPMVNVSLRFAESSLGAILAVLVAYIRPNRPPQRPA